MSDKPTHDYVAKRTCGCVACAIADHPLTKHDIGKELANWIANGYVIERVSTEYVRQHLWVCRLGNDFDTCDGRESLPKQMSLFEEPHP